MPRDYAAQYARAADLFKRATANAKSEDEREMARQFYEGALRDLALEQQSEAEAARPAAPARALTGGEKARGAARAFGQGVSFGFGEEAEALARSLAPGRTYGEEVKRIRGEMKEFRTAEPGMALGAEIAGSVLPTGLGAVRLAGRGLQAAGRAAQAVPFAGTATEMAGRGVQAAARATARNAALQGVLSGVGTAEGGVTDRGLGALVGGVAGGATGAVAGRLTGALTRGAERLRMGGGLKAPVGPRAAVLAAERAGITDLPAALREGATAAQPEATVMDVIGAPAQRMAAGIRLRGGRPGQMIEEAMTERVQEAPQRLMRALGATGRKRENIVRAVDDLVEEGDRASKPLYQAFEQSEEKAIPKLDAILETPFGRQVLERARRIAGNERRQFIEPGVPARPSPVLDEFGRPARVIAAEPAKYNPRTIDDIKKAMDAVIYDGKYGRVEAGQGGISPVELMGIKKLRRQFINAVDDAYPETYAAARQAWAGPYAARTALEDGAELAAKRFNPDEVAKLVDDYELGEIEYLQRGFLEGLAQRIDDNRLTPTEIKSEGFRKRMQVIFGDEADEIVSTLREQTTMTEAGRRVTGGSQTAERMQDLADIEGEALSGKAVRAFGEPTRTTARAAEWLETRLRTPVAEAKRRDVARTLLTPARGVGDLIRALEIEQAAQRRGEQVRRVVGGAVARQVGTKANRFAFNY